MTYKYIKRGVYSQNWLAKMMKYTWVIAVGIMFIAIGATHIRNVFAEDVTVYEKQEVEVLIEKPMPILDKIAKCESGGSHYDKNGQVLINRTQDVGLYQINVPIWGKEATKQGLNLYDEQDNKKFAEWLFLNYGSAPWVHSSKCWIK